MKKSSRAFHSIKFILFLIVLLFFSVILTCLALYLKTRHMPTDIRTVRIQYRDAVNAAEQKNYMYLKEYPCAVLNLFGQVTFSTLEAYPTGSLINLHSLSTINSVNEPGTYVVPLIDDTSAQSGFLMLQYNAVVSSSKRGLALSLLLLAQLLLLLLLCIGLLRLLHKKVTYPVASMCKLADSIMKYDYTEPTLSCDLSEVSELYHKLELIRSELQRSNEREKQLKQQEQVLLASISHDLKTPLASITGCAEGIQSGMVHTPEKLQSYASIILSKSQLLTTMINAIIENSSLAMEDYLIHPEEIYLKPFLKRVLDDFTEDLVQHHLELEIAPLDDVMVLIDPAMIYQVLQNLVSNSMKYTPAGGKLQLRSELMPSQNMVMLEFSDNGSGISHEDLPFVFDKFFRSERARTQNIPGNGLGLCIVKSIIVKHGGIVECESILGKGTTIAFSLPLA